MRRSPEMPREWPPSNPTPRQQAFLDRHNLVSGRDLDFHDASHVIEQFIRERRELSPTPKQEHFLRERGKWHDGLNRGQACDLIRRILAGIDAKP